MEEETKKVLEEYKDETKRHFDVVAEDLKDNMKLLSEQIGSNSIKIESNSKKLDDVSGQMSSSTETLEIIKMDLGFIKNELKQKISRDEFIILEKRVSLLENRSTK